MILAHVLSLSTGWISSFGVFRGRPRGPGVKRRRGLCSALARRHRVRSGCHHHRARRILVAPIFSPALSNARRFSNRDGRVREVPP